MNQRAGSSWHPATPPQNALHNEDIEPSITEAPGLSLDETTKPNANDNHLNSTPPKRKHQGDQRTHDNSLRTRESAIGHGLIATIKNFADDYLRKCDDCRKDLSDKHWKKFKEDISRIGSEDHMYPIVAKLLTEVCIAVCNPQEDSTKCLAVYCVANARMIGEGMQGSVMRPDLVFVWTTYASAKEIICPPADGVRRPAIHWSQIVSYVEVKKDRNMVAPSGQTSAYCHILPRAQPDHAGIHYSAITSDLFFFYWADTSGIVRSHRYRYEDHEDWTLLFRYVSTLVKPLPELPTRDSTMEHNKDTNRWTIKCKDKIYKNCELIDATCGQSRQTCVFLTEDSPGQKRIVKDLWFDEQRRFKEADLLEKIQGIPGVAQGDFSADVPGTGTKKLLQTSEMHSGPNSRLDWRRKAPRRTKKRCVLKSVGKKLKTRRSLLQIVKAIHDSLRAHQMCFKYKRILHRDVSRYNILIDPKHYDVDEFITKYKEAKFLGHILDEKNENKEEGMLIDWDTAADLEATDIGESLTHRTGTPIYVARSVASGRVFGKVGDYVSRSKFPEISEKAKALYIRAFGKDRYDIYRSAVNSSVVTKELEKEVEMRHTGFHDVESFVWVLFHELLLAWPKNSEDDGDELGDEAREALRDLESHVFGKGDSRASLLNANTRDWEENLHPGLSFLAPVLDKISVYIQKDWAFWPELPEDHVHEALAIMLLEMACLIEENGDIELREEERGAALRAKDKTTNVHVFPSQFELTPHRPRKRTNGASQSSAPKRTKMSTQDNAQAGPSNLANATGSAHQGSQNAVVQAGVGELPKVQGAGSAAS